MLRTIINSRHSCVFVLRRAPDLLRPIGSFIPILPQLRSLASDSRPKKPPTNYLLFCQKRRPQLATDYPELTFGEIGRQLGEDWKNLSDQEREVFSQQAKELSEDYHRQMKEFKSSLTDAEQDEMREEARLKRISREKRKTKAETKAELERLEKPKKPPNSFSLFVADNSTPGEPVATQVHRLSEDWNNLSEEVKRAYQEKAKRLQENYHLDFEAWKERMIAEGREDLFKATKTRRPKKGQKKDKEERWDEEEEDF